MKSFSHPQSGNLQTKVPFFWDMMLCHLAIGVQSFRTTQWFYLQGSTGVQTSGTNYPVTCHIAAQICLMSATLLQEPQKSQLHVNGNYVYIRQQTLSNGFCLYYLAFWIELFSQKLEAGYSIYDTLDTVMQNTNFILHFCS